MNINQKAIELLEENKYDESLKLFQQALQELRDVQSLTNLAWIYCHEEDDYIAALGLLEEAIKMNPISYFPYNLLGEVYLRTEKWEDAKDILQKSIEIQPTKEAYNNLAMANYNLGNVEAAAKYFLLGSDESDWALYGHVKCLLELGYIDEAKRKLDTFSQDDEEFVGEIDLADLYIEVGSYIAAVEWFEKGWTIYAKHPDWISRYVFSLMKLNKLDRSNEILHETIKEKTEELKDLDEEEVDETWTETDKQEIIRELQDEIAEYKQTFKRISSAYIPSMEFEPFVKTACYLFGCNRHNHPEYKG
ncbi:tetratricopeptide repeat protein [Neobacillus sp. KR4-4]|uniref:tetratricopeptide repeat protein n=1 Tax=Neobacillus sp. KR4-4 TaxID=3344872 RepID=UPI0035CC3BEA